MSNDEVSDIRDRLSTNGERLARIETQIGVLAGMLEKSLSGFGDLANRVSTLEHLRTRLIVLASVVGAGFTLAWEFLKQKLAGG